MRSGKILEDPMDDVNNDIVQWNYRSQACYCITM
jgi:hypothetical protein